MKHVSPMLARVGSTDLLTNEKYIFEPKLDGFRALCYINNGTFQLISRNGHDITHLFEHINFLLYIYAKNAILDGEIVAYNKKGLPSFSLLQQGKATTYIVFDILRKNNKWLIDLPLFQRKKILDSTIKTHPPLEKIIYTNNGTQLWHAIKKRHLEGVMAKEIEGIYKPAERSNTWLKIKQFKTLDCIIVGYTTTKRAISSLALGLFINKQLTCIGNVGTGFNQNNTKLLLEKLQLLEPQITDVKHPEYAGKTVQWVKPNLVAEVKYIEFTPYQILRTAVFLRIRTDKKPAECTLFSQI